MTIKHCPALLALTVLATSCAHHLQHTESHVHGPGCGHIDIVHDGHIDYLHDGHLHHPHDGHVDEHFLEVSAINPDQCTLNHAGTGDVAGHQHGPNCGHEAMPHGTHTDYLVAGHLHHLDGAHCDDHGPVQLAGK